MPSAVAAPDAAVRIRESFQVLEGVLHGTLPKYLPVLRQHRDVYPGQREAARKFLQWNLVDRLWGLVRAGQNGYLTAEQAAELNERLRELGSHLDRLEAAGIRVREELQSEIAARTTLR